MIQYLKDKISKMRDYRLRKWIYKHSNQPRPPYSYEDVFRFIKGKPMSGRTY